MVLFLCFSIVFACVGGDAQNDIGVVMNSSGAKSGADFRCLCVTLVFFEGGTATEPFWCVLAAVIVSDDCSLSLGLVLDRSMLSRGVPV